MTGVWPWLTFSLLGAYHGINPGMGWLFAVALGLQEKTRWAVLRALPPIALGHAASIGGVVVLVGVAQRVMPEPILRYLGAGTVLSFGLFRLLRSRHPRLVGMRVGPKDLTVWSFMMASAHGAGLMLVPALLRCQPSAESLGRAHHSVLSASLAQISFTASSNLLVTAVGVHTFSLLLVAGAVAVLVYEKLGLAVLRHAWINLDLVWTVALLLAGASALVL
jgi:hypothetical protein